jgi:uroporphyrinogen decarboxylase
LNKEFSSFERVKFALEHKEADRIPFDIGGAAVSGINVNSLRNLRLYLGMSDEVNVRDKITQLAHTGEDLIEKLKIDVKNVSPNPPSKRGLTRELGQVGDYYQLIDEFGIGWQMPVKGGHFYDLYLHPFNNVDSPEDITRYPWPDPLDPKRFENIKEKADQIVYQEKKAYVLGRMSSGMWENAMWMTGYEKFFSDMYANEKLIHTIMEKFLEIKMRYWEKALETVGENVMIISTADDLGTQSGLLVSLDMYKKLIWPYHKRLFEFIKKKAKSKVYIFFHNDGAIMKTIPLLIEAGVDILNPFQVNCAGMDTKKFKKEFGNDLTIWGGSCDSQFIMPRGTPDQVRDETRRRIEDLAPGGGFIFAPIHVIQGDVPPQNIMAWWETLQEYGTY